MFRKLLETMNKEVKITRRIMYGQTDNISKEKESIKRNQAQILELKSTIRKMKNSVERFTTRFE